MNEEFPHKAFRAIPVAAPDDGVGRSGIPNKATTPGRSAEPLSVRSGRKPPIILEPQIASGLRLSTEDQTKPAKGEEENVDRADPPIAPLPIASPSASQLDQAEGVAVVSNRPGWLVRPKASADPSDAGIAFKLSRAVRTEEENLIAPFVDVEYYHATYGDVLTSNIDPVVHYARHGWKERRNPSRSFNTGFYLDTNPDVATVDVNPLWHYVVTGRDEGRRAVKPANISAQILRDLVPPEIRSQAYVKPMVVTVATNDALRALLLAQADATSLVVSVSHDDYTTSIGGTQIFISDEQTKFVQAGAAYLHVSPLVARLRLAAIADGVTLFRLIMNGRLIGFADAQQLIETLEALRTQLPAERQFICHCLMGHRTDEIIALHDAMQPQRAIYWIHDYSSICNSVTLMRNDVTFCGAPPADSAACRICIHGRSRPGHLERFQDLFNAVSFDVVAPSRSALDLWTARAHLPARSTTVHPHASINFTAVRRSLVPISDHGTVACPIRVAFAGHPATHKGWPTFSALQDEVEKHGHFEFYHFWQDAGQAADPRLKGVPVTVTATERGDMIRALQQHAIDLVLVLSTWPETFSYVTYEAMASGADVITFADSGNVAAEVLRSGRGLVMRDFPSLLEFFVSGSAVRYVRLCYEQGNQAGELLHNGTSASLTRDAMKPSKFAKPLPVRVIKPAGRETSPVRG